jgi:hypothetical protein
LNWLILPQIDKNFTKETSDAVVSHSLNYRSVIHVMIQDCVGSKDGEGDRKYLHDKIS